MKNRKYAYVCSQFRADTQAELQQNIEHARKACRAVYKEGYTPIAPHLYFPQFLDDSKQDERNEGLAIGLELLSKCDRLFVIPVPGKPYSEGMLVEIDKAVDLGLYVDQSLSVQEKSNE